MLPKYDKRNGSGAGATLDDDPVRTVAQRRDVDGKPTCGSVVGNIHLKLTPIDADNSISLRGANGMVEIHAYDICSRIGSQYNSRCWVDSKQFTARLNDSRSITGGS
jgi:hypothetical protein